MVAVFEDFEEDSQNRSFVGFENPIFYGIAPTWPPYSCIDLLMSLLRGTSLHVKSDYSIVCLVVHYQPIKGQKCQKYLRGTGLLAITPTLVT